MQKHKNILNMNKSAVGYAMKNPYQQDDPVSSGDYNNPRAVASDIVNPNPTRRQNSNVRPNYQSSQGSLSKLIDPATRLQQLREISKQRILEPKIADQNLDILYAPINKASEELINYEEPKSSLKGKIYGAIHVSSKKYDFKDLISNLIGSTKAVIIGFKNYREKHKLLAYPTIAAGFTIFLLVIIPLYLKVDIFSTSVPAVAGVSDKAQYNFDIAKYDTWINDKNSGVYSEPEKDIDGDGLTNEEEFNLNTNPVSKFTCDQNKSDAENLFNLIDPATCKPIDANNPNAIEKFKNIISVSNLNKQFLEKTIDTSGQSEPVNKDSLLDVFKISNYDDLSGLNPNSIKEDAKITETKLDYLKTIDRIDKYIKKYRSYDQYDRDYASPIHPAVYLQVSLKYKVPLKYVLTLARTESRMGTDRYDSDGNLTRPGKYKNIYSMGLDDSGNNIGFNTWEDGVEAFGKWYKKFNDRGISDCNKWRIYNPNGDYCAKVESWATDAESFIKY